VGPKFRRGPHRRPVAPLSSCRAPERVFGQELSTPCYISPTRRHLRDIRMSRRRLVALINAVVSGDWELTEGVGVKDASQDLLRCIPPEERDGISLVMRVASRGMTLETIFPSLRPGLNVNALIIMAHTAPVNPADKPDPKHPSGQYLSLSAKGVFAFIQFERVASLIQRTVRRTKYNMILLACYQGDKLLKLLLPSVRSDGVIVYFGGPDESPTDGVHLFLAQDMVEKTLELIHACVAADEPLNAVELFHQLYTQLGQEYVGPSDQRRHDKDHNGEYIYSEYVLTTSSEGVLKHPRYLKDYMLAGHLHGYDVDMGELVPFLDLITERSMVMAQVQRDVDREPGRPDDGAGPASGAPASSRVD
jgi:hypothetical protein